MVKLGNTSATSTKNSENRQKQVQRCQQVPHWVIQGHDDQAGHHLALPSQNQAEIRVGHQQVGEEDQVVGQGSQLLHNHGQRIPFFRSKDNSSMTQLATSSYKSPEQWMKSIARQTMTTGR